jgi:hypothetical protein
MMATQLAMDLPVSLPDDAYAYGARTSGETHGVVLTRSHVVDLILDLAGYTVDRDLGALTLLDVWSSPLGARGTMLRHSAMPSRPTTSTTITLPHHGRQL